MSGNNVVRKFNNYDRESTMKNVKNMNNIAAIATARVNELIANGFIFNFGTMAGSQGDDFKADLTKDGIIYRVRVFHDFGYNGFDDAESAIAPKKVIEKVRAHRGYKRTKVEDIKRIVRKNNKYTGKVTYVVEFKNRVSKTADFKLNLN